MSIFRPKLYFVYLAKHYLKNVLAILFGLSFAFAAIDYFQHAQKLSISGSYKILYIYYMWQQALGLLYPLAIVFASDYDQDGIYTYEYHGCFTCLWVQQKKS
ncbi:MAG: hypothetical protein Q9M36_07495 [Sulfurovum sp.]|nr:hypothetical protein [Sulfurovum sp.]